MRAHDGKAKDGAWPRLAERPWGCQNGRMKALVCVLLMAWAGGAAAATNAVVDYNALGYADERFTLAGAPFTGDAVQTNRAGRLVARRQFADGRYHGRTEEYHPNGQPSARIDFERGERHGTNIYWNADGTVLKQQRWEHGKLVESTHREDLP